jgi:Flp pilus assembly protein TadD
MAKNQCIEASFAARRRMSGLSLLLLLTPLIASCSTQTGGFTRQVVDSQEASPAAPDAQALLRVADATKANGDNADAAELYKRLVKEHPELVKARTSLGQAMLDKGDPALALRYFNDAKKLDPSDVASMVGAGQAHMARHEPLQAQKAFREALAKEPQNVAALNGLGVALDAVESHGLAQENYQKALGIEPGNQAVRNNYGLSLALSGLHEQAVAELLPLAKEEGEVGRKARQNLALSYAMRGDFVTASRWAQIDLKPEDIRNDLKVYGSTASR